MNICEFRITIFLKNEGRRERTILNCKVQYLLKKKFYFATILHGAIQLNKKDSKAFKLCKMKFFLVKLSIPRVSDGILMKISHVQTAIYKQYLLLIHTCKIVNNILQFSLKKLCDYIGKNLPQFLWDEAVSHAAYLRNHALTQALKGKTPYKAWHKLIPSVAHLREFGSDIWILDESKNRSKLNPKSKKTVFVRFMDGSKSVHYYDAKRRNIKVSRNFTFNENEEPGELKEIAKIPSLQAESESTPLRTELKTPLTFQDATKSQDTQEIPGPRKFHTRAAPSAKVHSACIRI